MKFIASINNAYGNKPGIALSFDDSFRHESWLYYHNNYGIDRNWKASFFVNSHVGAAKATFLILDAYGHSMENHTTTHYNGVNDYLLTHTHEEYYLEYMKPVDDWLALDGISVCKTFRYPYGYSNQGMTDWLLENTHYTMIYHANTNYATVPVGDNISIYNYANLNYGFRLDTISFEAYDQQDYMNLLTYCKANGKIVSMVGHHIGPGWTNGARYSEISLINRMVDFINDNNMVMYTARELADIKL